MKWHESGQNIDQTVAMLLTEQEDQQPDQPAIEHARRRIADCDCKLSQHRAALEAGADPATVSGWMREELDKKAEAQRQLDRMPK
jgi:site-specific DNA recombinase